VVQLGSLVGDMGEVGRPVECMPIICVPVSVLELLCPLHGANGNIFVVMVSHLVSRGWLMTTKSCTGHGMMCTGWGVTILVVMRLETRLISCCPIFLCSIGWEVPEGGVMVGCLRLEEICL